MRRRDFFYVIVLGNLLMACEGAIPSEVPDSGIEGIVRIGPTSPIVEQGATATGVPYEAIIFVRDKESGRKVAEVQSDADGTFRVVLPPGVYTVEPQSPNPGAPPFAESQRVVVEPGRFRRVEIVYESGIR